MWDFDYERRRLRGARERIMLRYDFCDNSYCLIFSFTIGVSILPIKVPSFCLSWPMVLTLDAVNKFFLVFLIEHGDIYVVALQRNTATSILFHN